MSFQTEVEFTLPKGYIDQDSVLHRTGVMRLATAADEILPLKDPRVQQNPAYLTVIVLARVITRLGTVEHVNTRTIEHLYAADLAYLQDLYVRVNTVGHTRLHVACPHCEGEFDVDPTPDGPGE